MKYIITESQYKLLTEEKTLNLDFDVFNKDWDLLQRFLDKKGNPEYTLIGNLDLGGRRDITSLGNLTEVIGNVNLIATSIPSLGKLKYIEGSLSLYKTNIEDLGELTKVVGNIDMRVTKIKSLGNLKFVDGNLEAMYTPLESLGDLRFVGGNLHIEGTPISFEIEQSELLASIDVLGNVYI